MELLTLRFLSISSNYLEFIPPDWSPLYNLEELDLSSNRIVDISPLLSIRSLKILNLSENMISVLPYDIYKLKNLFSLNCQRNQIYQLPNSLAQMKLLQELDVLENPLVFPPFNIVSRGLAHILAFLSRKEQKAPLHPPPLQQQQYEEEEDLVEEVAEKKPSFCQNPISPPATLLSSPTASRPSSAMATVTWQKSYPPTTSDRTESSHSDRHILRRRSSQPEFYKHVATASGDTDYSSVSLTSLSEDEASALGLHQPCDSQQLWREENYGQAYPSYLTISHKPQEMNLERYGLFTGSHDRPQPPPRSAFPSSIAGRSKLYVRQRTPSPPPRRPRPLAPLPRLPDASLPNTRPPLRSQRSYPPPTHSLHSRLPDEPSQVKLNALNVELARLPHQASNTSADLSEESEDDFSTDSSCEDLPVPRLRNHLPLSVTPSPSTQHHLTRRPGQSVPPTTASLQHRRYLKHGKATGSVHPKANPSLLHHQQRSSQVGERLCRSDHPSAAFSPPHQMISPSHEILRSPQPLYSQTHQYDELWRSTAEALRTHRLFSVTRVLAADTTVGLFGLLHCLQTLLEVWASRPSTFMMGGLGVREKLSNQPTSYRSLLGDITTNRHMRHQSQQRYHHRTFSNPNYGLGVNGCGGVFSDV
ncbi:unnamed protein product [Taenia asiatica]|uniref:Calponin-homology (CH) domain-containing protein n=1 Tax=Taenia asiatica TaxID=60517 RepID=A0A0R3VTH4_TAEAS|nr:unnamed protein product [Taenia asiatica]